LVGLRTCLETKHQPFRWNESFFSTNQPFR
jgi:hypothetical protein